MKRRRSNPLLNGKTETDMTSMIDVVFLLLVFFLATATFKIHEGKLESELPKDGGEALSAEQVRDLIDPIALHVVMDEGRTQGVAVHVGPSRVADLGELPALIAGVMAIDPERRGRISTGPGVEYGHVIAVLDACLIGGLGDLLFATPAG